LIAVTLPLYLWATIGANWRSPALFAALAAPTTAIAIVSGQNGFLAGALLAGGLRLAAGHPLAAGVLFGLLTYKPQLGLLVPVALAAAGLWRTLTIAGVTAILLVALTSLLFGGAIWVVAERRRAGDAFGTGEVLIMILAMIAPMTLAAGTSNFPLATLALILLLGVIVRRCRRLRSRAAPAQLLAPARF